jgi:hypothetical protein
MATKTELETKVVELESQFNLILKERDSLRKHLESVQYDLQVARDSLEVRGISTPQVEENTEDHVILDGKRYQITWRSTVKDLDYEGLRKRYVAENDTAIVINKTGG